MYHCLNFNRQMHRVTATAFAAAEPFPSPCQPPLLPLQQGMGRGHAAGQSLPQSPQPRSWGQLANLPAPWPPRVKASAMKPGAALPLSERACGAFLPLLYPCRANTRAGVLGRRWHTRPRTLFPVSSGGAHLGNSIPVCAAPTHPKHFLASVGNRVSLQHAKPWAGLWFPEAPHTSPHRHHSTLSTG